MIEISELILRFLTGITLLATLVFVIGIVWRVEAELDVAYKWFTLTVVFLGISEIVELLPSLLSVDWGGLMGVVTRFLATLTLFMGMYYMRDLVRRMDGERH